MGCKRRSKSFNRKSRSWGRCNSKSTALPPNRAGWIPACVLLTHYPQLRALAWQVQGTDTDTDTLTHILTHILTEVLDIHERNARHLGLQTMSANAQALFQALFQALLQALSLALSRNPWPQGVVAMQFERQHHQRSSPPLRLDMATSKLLANSAAAQIEFDVPTARVQR